MTAAALNTLPAEREKSRFHGAIAVFVKTPGLSPIKTRLAANLGIAQAAEFYRLALNATAAMVQAACRSLEDSAITLTPYWAVAEPEAMDWPGWSTFATTSQGSGGLGTRLDHVYRALLARHDFVLFIGADAPHVPFSVLTQGCEQLATSLIRQPDEAVFLLGRAEDGGYYLFGGCRQIEQALWESVPYSVATTADEFANRLRSLGEIRELPLHFDIDTIDDLRRFSEIDASQLNLLEEQQRAIEWASWILMHPEGETRVTAD